MAWSVDAVAVGASTGHATIVGHDIETTGLLAVSISYTEQAERKEAEKDKKS